MVLSTTPHQKEFQEQLPKHLMVQHIYGTMCCLWRCQRSPNFKPNCWTGQTTGARTVCASRVRKKSKPGVEHSVRQHGPRTLHRSATMRLCLLAPHRKNWHDGCKHQQLRHGSFQKSCQELDWTWTFDSPHVRQVEGPSHSVVFADSGHDWLSDNT